MKNESIQFRVKVLLNEVILILGLNSSFLKWSQPFNVEFASMSTANLIMKLKKVKFNVKLKYWNLKNNY